MRKGIAVSPGVAVGTAYCLNEIYVSPDSKRLEDREVSAELARYETACDRAASDLRALRIKVERQVGKRESEIFEAHESILRDPSFRSQVRKWIIDDRNTATAALHRLLNEYTSLFARIKNPYFKERLADVRDVVMRIATHLTDYEEKDTLGLAGPLVIVANELLPSQAVTLGKLDVVAIATQAGSQTSHAAIVARSRGIPAVSGLRGLLRQVKTGDTLVVDGRDGVVLVNPPPETLAAYRKLQREFVDLKDVLAANRDQPALLKDGESLELLANVNGVPDALAAVAMGATGVGLFRTEYIYLTHPSIPDEEEQLAAYCEVIDAIPGRRVTIRTLDIGGDKTVPYLGHDHQEANPFLGWRSIRLSFEHPSLFLTQLRAVLRAGARAAQHGGQLRLLFPMITTLEEIRRVHSLIRRACTQLTEAGREFARVPIGMMLEVPAAAVSIQTMLPSVDFVSIGSNDLVQYLMAADRDNPKVSHLCQPLAPAVLKTLARVIRSCNRANKPVTLCGELAGQPRAVVALLGMGLRSFSMSPAFIPSVKELARLIDRQTAETLLADVLKMKTTIQVQRHLAHALHELAPGLEMLETH